MYVYEKNYKMYLCVSTPVNRYRWVFHPTKHTGTDESTYLLNGYIELSSLLLPSMPRSLPAHTDGNATHPSSAIFRCWGGNIPTPITR